MVCTNSQIPGICRCAERWMSRSHPPNVLPDIYLPSVFAGVASGAGLFLRTFISLGDTEARLSLSLDEDAQARHSFRNNSEGTSCRAGSTFVGRPGEYLPAHH